MVNKGRLISLAQELIRIDSQNPGSNESEIARYLSKYLVNLGLKPKIYEFKKGRSNIIACLKGQSNKHSLLITPHLDTVPAGNNWNLPPFGALIKKGRIYGLGATDCKVNVAVSLEAINSIIEDNSRLGYDLIFAATADEEAGSDLGLIPLLNKGILKPTAALVLDADEFAVVVAQKGLIHLKVKIKGKKAHGAYPWRGINAIDAAVEILHDLKRFKPSFKKNKFFKGPTLNFGTIHGGDKVNVVADWCEFELDFRFLPGQNPKTILKALKRIVKRHSHKYKIEVSGMQNDYAIDVNHPLVRALIAALKKMRIRPKVCGSEGATTITFFQGKNIPATATGFGSESCAHAIDEYVKINNLYKGALVLEEFLRNYKF